MSKPSLGLFSHADVRKIRQQAAARSLDTSAWADAFGCSVETIRRIARRESYRFVLDAAPIPTGETNEISEAELSASLARLTQAAIDSTPQPTEVSQLLDELANRKEKS